MSSLTSTGLIIDTVAELQTQLTQDMQNIYGQGIDLSSDTPDGQMMLNYIQSAIDTEETVQQVFNSFDPDNAVGIVLDQRCAINGIQREMGTFTTTNVKITFGSTGTLYGLNQTAQPVYTVTDSTGTTQWQLQTTVTKTVGSYELPFQASIVGPITTTIGTITVPVTVDLSVTSIINDQAYLVLGTAQESDNQFKVRRQQSTAIGSQGYYNGLVAQLENISGIGVGNVMVYENNTASTSNGSAPPHVPSGIPSHSIWVVVGGGAASESTIGGVAGANALAIATAIYNKRNAGCGMLGSQSYAITQADGSLFPVFWDVVIQVPLFIKFLVGSINGTSFPNIQALRDSIPTSFLPGINQTVNASEVVIAANAIDPNSYVSSVGYALTYNGSYTATLSSSSGLDQFNISSANIIVTPMVMTSPTCVIDYSTGIPLVFTVSDTAVHSGGTIQFTALGGYGAYTYSVLSNHSGGSIGSLTGLYSPGTTPSVIDTVRVIDTLSNSATVSITVA